MCSAGVTCSTARLCLLQPPSARVARPVVTSPHVQRYRNVKFYWQFYFLHKYLSRQMLTVKVRRKKRTVLIPFLLHSATRNPTEPELSVLVTGRRGRHARRSGREPSSQDHTSHGIDLPHLPDMLEHIKHMELRCSLQRCDRGVGSPATVKGLSCSKFSEPGRNNGWGAAAGLTGCGGADTADTGGSLDIS